MKIEYRICDLGDKHANPVNATFVVDNGEEEHDVCDIHVSTLVTAGVLNGSDYITVTRIGTASEKKVVAPRDARSWLLKNNIKGQSMPQRVKATDEPCQVCGQLVGTRQGLSAHYRIKHGNSALLHEPYKGTIHPVWLAWKERKENEVNG